MKRAWIFLLLLAGMGAILWPQQPQFAQGEVQRTADELPPRPTPPAASPTSPPPPVPVPTMTPLPLATATPPPLGEPTATPHDLSKGGKSKGSGKGVASDVRIVGWNTSYQTSPGKVVELIATVSNGERGVAREVQITSTLPPFLELVGVTSSWGTVSTTDRMFRIDISQLMPKDEVRVHALARIVDHAIPPYNKCAIVVTSQNDTNPDNNMVRFMFWTFNQ